MDANISSMQWLICQIIRLLCPSTSDEIIFLFLSNNRWTHSLLGQLRSYVKRTFIFGYQILLTFATHIGSCATHIVQFYGLCYYVRFRQGHKRDMQSSHEYVLLPYTRAPHLCRIYRTLMHNALRDDGKYGYITHQRPMLFSLASHWLMLIRNQQSHTLATETIHVH